MAKKAVKRTSDKRLRKNKNKIFRQAPGYTVAHLSVTLILTQARDTHVNREGNLLEQQALTGGI